MKTWDDFLTENNRPGSTPMADRSLEGFRNIMDQLQMQMKSVMNPEAKQELQPIVNQFYQQMREVLTRYKNQNIGYSQNYQPNPNPGTGQVH